MATIHQPSAEIFFGFDNLLLLAPGGHQVYFGAEQKRFRSLKWFVFVVMCFCLPIFGLSCVYFRPPAGPLGHHASSFVRYLQPIPGVKPLPQGVNPASWMLTALETGGGGNGGGAGQTTEAGGRRRGSTAGSAASAGAAAADVSGTGPQAEVTGQVPPATSERHGLLHRRRMKTRKEPRRGLLAVGAEAEPALLSYSEPDRARPATSGPDFARYYFHSTLAANNNAKLERYLNAEAGAVKAPPAVVEHPAAPTAAAAPPTILPSETRAVAPVSMPRQLPQPELLMAPAAEIELPEVRATTSSLQSPSAAAAATTDVVVAAPLVTVLVSAKEASPATKRQPSSPAATTEKRRSRSDAEPLVAKDTEDTGPMQPLQFSKITAVPFYKQFYFVFLRASVAYWRNAEENWVRFLVLLYLGVLFGLLFINVEFTTFQGVQSGLGFVLGATAWASIIFFTT